MLVLAIIGALNVGIYCIPLLRYVATHVYAVICNMQHLSMMHIVSVLTSITNIYMND